MAVLEHNCEEETKRKGDEGKMAIDGVPYWTLRLGSRCGFPSDNSPILLDVAFSLQSKDARLCNL